MYRLKNDAEVLEAMKALVEAIACSASTETLNDVSVYVVSHDPSDDEPLELSAHELAQSLFEYNTTG